MFEDGLFRRHSGKITFVAGCLVGVFLTTLGFSLSASQGAGNHSAVSVIPAHQIGNVTGNATSIVFDSEPEYTLRLLQAIGILLPLFTGLLRFTTSDQSEVSEQVNDYLLVGVVGLVLGGVFAALGAIMTDTAVILKISLLFVLVTFGVIGFAAMKMLGERGDSTEDFDDRDSKLKPEEGDAGDAPTTATGPEPTESSREIPDDDSESPTDETTVEVVAETDRDYGPKESPESGSEKPASDQSDKQL